MNAYRNAFIELLNRIDEIESDAAEYTRGDSQVNINPEEGIFLEVQAGYPWHVSYWNRNADPPIFFDEVDASPDMAMAKLSMFLDDMLTQKSSTGIEE